MDVYFKTDFFQFFYLFPIAFFFILCLKTGGKKKNSKNQTK